MELKKINWNPFKSNNKHKTKAMNFEKISKAVGREISAENFASLTEAELVLVEQSLSSPETPVATLEVTEEQNQLSAEAISAQVVEALQPTLTNLQEQINALKEDPAAEATVAPKVTPKTEEQSVHSWEDPNDPVNQRTKKELGL